MFNVLYPTGWVGLVSPFQKSVTEWVSEFTALFKPIFRSDNQSTVVLLNAIGYIFINMSVDDYDYEGKAEFLVRT